MTQDLSDRGLQSNPLINVHEGMAVYDADRKELGHVKGLFMGTNPVSEEQGKGPATTASTPTRAQNTVLDDFARAMGAGPDIPDEFRGRLEREGFIRIGGGLFHADRYATPEQVATVEANAVYLNVQEDQLLRR